MELLVNPFIPLFIGAILGLLGGGGSVLMVPILVYIYSLDPKVAIASSLFVVSMVSFLGVFPHHRMGNVSFKAALLFAPFAMLGTFFGAKLSILFSGSAQLVLFSITMAIASWFMLNKKEHGNQDGPPKKGHLALIGLGVGVLTGLVGVGGGFMIVPVLVLMAKIPMKRAVGTSLLVISVNSLTGFIGYLGMVQIPINFVVQFAIFMVSGLYLGTYSSKFISQQNLRKVFAYFLIVISLFILYQNKESLIPKAIAATFGQ